MRPEHGPQAMEGSLRVPFSGRSTTLSTGDAGCQGCAPWGEWQVLPTLIITRPQEPVLEALTDGAGRVDDDVRHCS